MDTRKIRARRAELHHGLLAVMFLGVGLTGCQPDDSGDRADAQLGASTEAERGALGKADRTGSCRGEGGADACGGPASTGGCWCDDQCVLFGDCCSDVAEVCRGELPPDPCEGEAGHLPLSFEPVSHADLQEAQHELQLACEQAYEGFCLDATVDAYAVPICLSPAVGLDDIVFERTQRWPSDYGLSGATVGRDELEQDLSKGALVVLDGFAGPGEPEAFRFVEEVPCHNCTSEQVGFVLWYPDAGLVFDLRATGGYDS